MKVWGRPSTAALFRRTAGGHRRGGTALFSPASFRGTGAGSRFASTQDDEIISPPPPEQGRKEGGGAGAPTEAKAKSSLDILQSLLMSTLRERGHYTDDARGVVTRPKRLELSDLRYFNTYPKRVKQWIIDCKTPKGVWEKDGTWYVTQALDEEPLHAGRDDGYVVPLAERADKVLPSDLRHRYRFGVTDEDLQSLGLAPDEEKKIKHILSFQHSGRTEINTFRIAECIARWRRKPSDTGSSEVQIAVLTEKIRYMSDHLQRNHKDQRTRRALSYTIDRRRALMKHLKKQDTTTYYHLLRDLNLRDMVAI